MAHMHVLKMCYHLRKKMYSIASANMMPNSQGVSRKYLYLLYPNSANLTNMAVLGTKWFRLTPNLILKSLKMANLPRLCKNLPCL